VSLSTRLDKLEAAMRGRDGGAPPDGRWICRLIYDPSEWQIEEDEAISRLKTEALDRLVAAGKIRAIALCAVLFSRLNGPMTLCPRTLSTRRVRDLLLHGEAVCFR
jgi:hypothetical protein